MTDEICVTDENGVTGEIGVTDENGVTGEPETATDSDAPSRAPETEKIKVGKKIRMFFKRNAKKIKLALIIVAAVAVILAIILLSVHFTGIREVGDYLSLPVVKLPADKIMTQSEAASYGGDEFFVRTVVDAPDGYIAHPDTVWVDDGTADGKILAVYPLGHGKGEIAMRESLDMGVTWSERRTGLPASWKDSQETPTVYNLTEGMLGVEGDGIQGLTGDEQVIVLISGCPYWPSTSYDADGFNFSYSVDGGDTWTEFEKFYGESWARQSGKSAFDCIVAMASLTQLRDADGNYTNSWMGLFHDHEFNVYKTILTCNPVYTDGVLNLNWQWSEPVALFGSGSANDDFARKNGMCEVEAVRVQGLSADSPYAEYDGAIILLARAEKRNTRSLISVSTDEGATWSTIRELPYDLCGDRHKAEYLDDSGNLIVSFRQLLPVKRGPLSTKARLGDGWYAWVGNVEDLLSYADDNPANDTDGDFLLEVGGTQFGGAYGSGFDNGYSGVVVRNGVVSLVGYGKFIEGRNDPIIMSCTFDATLFVK